MAPTTPRFARFRRSTSHCCFGKLNTGYKVAQRQNVVLDHYGVSFVIITDIWLVSLDCSNTLIMIQSETDN